MLKLSQSISPIRNNLETKKGHLQLKGLKMSNLIYKRFSYSPAILLADITPLKKGTKKPLYSGPIFTEPAMLAHFNQQS